MQMGADRAAFYGAVIIMEVCRSAVSAVTGMAVLHVELQGYIKNNDKENRAQQQNHS